MSEHCVCFTTDKGYLFPTIVSAIQARAHCSTSLADVAIYCVGAETSETEDFAEVCALENIHFTCLDSRVIDNSHVAYTRLFLDDFVPTQYKQLLYIDGDTQVLGSLDLLLAADVPQDKFLAATDPVAFKYDNLSDTPTELREYFSRLGLTSLKQYFNSGVLRINRKGWSRIGSQAYEFCRATDKNALNFWDQDGLNAIAAASGARLPMSMKYNFPIFLRNCRVDVQVQPAIYHFMSAPKPWNGNFPPWNHAATLPYRDISRKYPKLSRYQKPFGAWKKVRYFVQQRVKQLDEAISWGLSKRRTEVLLYEDRFRPYGI